jgi:hypothetical protein
MNNPGMNTTNETTRSSFERTSSTTAETASNFNRTTAVNTLAIVGFVALVGATMWLAVYSTRYVPTVVGRIGAAAVYVGSFFTPGSPTTPPVTATSTGSTATSTPVMGMGDEATSTPSTIGSTPGTGVKTPGQKTGTSVQIGGGTVAPYGNPDLQVSMVSVGYLTSASTDAYVPNTSVPSGERPAIKFMVKNVGTNWSGTWRFTAAIPTKTSFTYTSDIQQSLAPGDSIEYTLGFDRADVGTGKEVTLTVNSDHSVPDLNTANNTTKAYLNIQ